VTPGNAVRGFSDALMAECRGLPGLGGVTINTLNMTRRRDVTGLTRRPSITRRQNHMTAGTIRRTVMIHGRRCPCCASRVAGATGIKGHRRNVVCLDASDRPPGRILAVMAGCAIGVCQHSLVREL
jgi:hypothetical protein